MRFAEYSNSTATELLCLAMSTTQYFSDMPLLTAKRIYPLSLHI